MFGHSAITPFLGGKSQAALVLPNYCTPPVCVSDVLGALAVWRLQTKKKPSSITAHQGMGDVSTIPRIRPRYVSQSLVLLSGHFVISTHQIVNLSPCPNPINTSYKTWPGGRRSVVEDASCMGLT